MDTPGWVDYIDKFRARAYILIRLQGNSRKQLENGMGMWHSGNCGGL